MILFFIICAFIIYWAMIGYPLSLIILDKMFKKSKPDKNKKYSPTITVMVVAHNEEKVIVKKLENLISIDYPKDKYEIVVTSDFSTDKTNELVKKFIKEHKDYKISLHETVSHKGKTNAQNEAQKKISSEILVMTDANCYFKEDAVKEIVTCFSNPSVGYACGLTIFTNNKENRTADSESTYWNFDSKCRDIESRFQTITAGGGNLYACRTKEYKDIPLIECHDSSFPILFALDGYRAIFEPNAISYEKAGESDKDEYKRKVRMNRNIFHNILPSWKILNIFKYRWFTYFYLGHRTFRYLLWFAHIGLFISNFVLAFTSIWFWKVLLILHILVYLVSILVIKLKIKNKYLKMLSYYCLTIFAQINGVFNILTGKSKPTWAKAETTR